MAPLLTVSLPPGIRTPFYHVYPERDFFHEAGPLIAQELFFPEQSFPPENLCGNFF
jgi:hypothetical protein